MNAYALAECRRLLHDRGLVGWKLLVVRGNPDHPVNRWLTIWDDQGKMVMSIAKMGHGPQYYAHVQRMRGDNTWVADTQTEAMGIALDHWLAYKEQHDRIAEAAAEFAGRE